MAEQDSTERRLKRLETVNLEQSAASEMGFVQEWYLDGLRIEFEAVFGDQELLNIFALITLKLDHLTHLTVCNNRAIASYVVLALPPINRDLARHTEFLLNDLEDLLLVKLLGETLDSCQCLTTIAFYVTLSTPCHLFCGWEDLLRWIRMWM
jgi:hypothetical protein